MNYPNHSEGQPFWLRKKVVSKRFTTVQKVDFHCEMFTAPLRKAIEERMIGEYPWGLHEGGQWTVKTFCEAAVLRHNGGFYNTPVPYTLKRCLHRKVDFTTNATHNAHVSQLFPSQSRIVTKGLYYFIITDQNKLVEIGCSQKKCLFNGFPFWTDSLRENIHLKAQLFSFASIKWWRR